MLDEVNFISMLIFLYAYESECFVVEHNKRGLKENDLNWMFLYIFRPLFCLENVRGEGHNNGYEPLSVVKPWVTCMCEFQSVTRWLPPELRLDSSDIRVILLLGWEFKTGSSILRRPASRIIVYFPWLCPVSFHHNVSQCAYKWNILENGSKLQWNK